MYKKNSIYSINKKHEDAIIYPFADGKEARITREDFPSEEAFLAFKAWSDEDYRKTENYEDNTAKKTVSIDDISETAIAVPGADVIVARQEEKVEKRRKEKELIAKLKDKLTETQFRRLWMYEGEGKTLAQIAEHEGVAILSVYESIESAKKRISKKFPKTP